MIFSSMGDLKGVAARLIYNAVDHRFGMVWDEAESVKLPAKLAKAMVDLTTWSWPHTFVVPKYASMLEYKQYAPANHFHMTQNLPVARLQHWMDFTGVKSIAPWAARPCFIEGVDRPLPLVKLH